MLEHVFRFGFFCKCSKIDFEENEKCRCREQLTHDLTRPGQRPVAVLCIPGCLWYKFWRLFRNWGALWCHCLINCSMPKRGWPPKIPQEAPPPKSNHFWDLFGIHFVCIFCFCLNYVFKHRFFVELRGPLDLGCMLTFFFDICLHLSASVCSHSIRKFVFHKSNGIKFN